MRILDVPSAQDSVLRRRAWDEMNLPDSLLDGIERLFGERLTPEEVVRRILADVRADGDAALVRWAETPRPGDAGVVGRQRRTDCRGLRAGR